MYLLTHRDVKSRTDRHNTTLRRVLLATIADQPDYHELGAGRVLRTYPGDDSLDFNADFDQLARALGAVNLLPSHTLPDGASPDFPAGH